MLEIQWLKRNNEVRYHSLFDEFNTSKSNQESTPKIKTFYEKREIKNLMHEISQTCG